MEQQFIENMLKLMHKYMFKMITINKQQKEKGLDPIKVILVGILKQSLTKVLQVRLTGSTLRVSTNHTYEPYTRRSEVLRVWEWRTTTSTLSFHWFTLIMCTIVYSNACSLDHLPS